jgi:hypothetical protein
MAVILNASTSSGFVQTADTSGVVQIQNNGTTRLEANGTGVVVTGTGSVSGDLSFNSGYGSAAVAYGCRAWVNFNGGGTVAIRASGNVSSITDNGVGLYTINFTTSMPDVNYSVAGMSGIGGGNWLSIGQTFNDFTTTQDALTTSSVAIRSGEETNVNRDVDCITIQIFR